MSQGDSHTHVVSQAVATCRGAGAVGGRSSDKHLIKPTFVIDTGTVRGRLRFASSEVKVRTFVRKFFKLTPGHLTLRLETLHLI